MLEKLNSDMRKNKPGPLSYTYTKVNSKWMKDLNVRQEAIKIFEEKAGKNLFDLGRSNFLSTRLQTQGNKSKNELLEHHQKKNLHSKGNNQQN